MTVSILRVRMMRMTTTATTKASIASRRSLSIGRMLDMGGMPAMQNDQTMVRHSDVSKYSKLQAVAFDFELLTRTIEKSKIEIPKTATTTTPSTTTTTSTLAPVEPDLSMVQQVASLLNVKFDTSTTTGGTKEQHQNEPANKKLKPTSFSEDVRAKYAKKLQGGLAGIELAKHQVNETLQKGDATGHMAARKIAMQQQTAGTRWMAMTGAGKMLTYLTHRSIQIALVNTKPNPQMYDFEKQLSNVVVDAIIDQYENPKDLMAQLVAELGKDPGRTLLVSDRDDYLRAARDLGMITCRLRPKNARQGNVTTVYTKESVLEVQELVNEINGISFNVTLNR
jgi:beta-phosphoglucomutase-like phosphatase (HAD superfamily)